MHKPNTKVYDIVLDFYESDKSILKIDTSPWRSSAQAIDSIRHCIKQKGFKDVVVHRIKGDVYLLKL